ncbi:Uncharacterized protein, contains PIN domain [Xaviernesmea oryzae]|uniref:Ribonuclease VapC n=1 Tax=Xaviernesmea oryzae TaxID=464029 RepID=A0A1X7FDQ4_9HYPH|nr:type II toxin-antitoxin system VapC family toxin [Xaviernesmea oryzae]SMF50552.1 Uncharacterized protein, contains PIN domain [Xaviernesmea oryzae]
MFIDSSALVEILSLAPRRQKLLERLAAASTPLSTSATVIYETSVVLARETRKDVVTARNFVLEFLDELDVEVIPMTRSTAIAATDAFARYGKGRHPAKLNFGDCFSYAGAREAGTPLLYVGEDVAQTDLA